MAIILENDTLTIAFDDDSWKTEQPEIITNVVNSSSGFYSSDLWKYNDKNVLRSGAIGNNGTSQTIINFTLNFNGSIEFNYKVSSETNYDWFYILIDDVEVVKQSGEVDFTVYTQNLDAGEHTLTLKYTKDNSSASGSDCGAIGYIRLTGIPPQIVKKYLIVEGETIYSFNGLELTPTELIYSELVADNFLNFGFDEITTDLCRILKSYTTFKILHWQDDVLIPVPLYTGIVQGTPTNNQTLIFNIDLSEAVSTIKYVESVFKGSPLLAFSVDDGVTWEGYNNGWIDGDMYLSNVHLLTETVMTELIGENKNFKVRITLSNDDEFTSLKFIYEEES